MKHTAKWINLPSQPLGEGEALTTNRLRTYSIRIKMDAPHPSPITATTRITDGEFVWERLVTCKGRAEAVSIAGRWFQDLRTDGSRHKGSVGKVLVGTEAHQCLTVDDVGNECLYGSNFKPHISNNRLLDKETIERVIEESKGNLKIADSPFVKGQAYPALEWNTTKKVNNDPIKVAFSTFVNPTKGGMKESLDGAVARAKKRKVSWTREMELKDARVIVQRMKAKNEIESRTHKYQYKDDV
jgi:hypothetical protein